MQNSNPSHPFPVSTEPSISADALARAYERARARLAGGEPKASHPPAAVAGFRDEHPGENAGPRGPAAPHAATSHESGARSGSAPREGRVRVTLDELLPVFRDPIDWVLGYAEGHAQGDPVDLAAIDRVRAAYQSRLVSIGTAGAIGDARAKVRPTDLLTVAGLLLSSIDPSFARRASAGARASLLDALAAVIPIGLAQPPSDITAQPPAALFCYVDEIADAPAPFSPPRMPRLAGLSCCCCCGHHHVR